MDALQQMLDDEIETKHEDGSEMENDVSDGSHSDIEHDDDMSLL